MEVELKNLRLQVAQMITRGGEGHIPSSFSILDLVYGVYEYALRQSDNVYVDKFVLSKGHGAAALYAVLSHFDIIPKELLDQYGTSGSPLGGHPDRSKIPGVEANTGSLGHGMPFGTGLALGNKILKRDQRVFVLVGDGECQEGTIWEAANIASNNHLESLVVIVDWNGSAAQLQPIEKVLVLAFFKATVSGTIKSQIPNKCVKLSWSYHDESSKSICRFNAQVRRY
jgi:transketolase